jgi:hypothetical protein
VESPRESTAPAQIVSQPEPQRYETDAPRPAETPSEAAPAPDRPRPQSDYVPRLIGGPAPTVPQEQSSERGDEPAAETQDHH